MTIASEPSLVEQGQKGIFVRSPVARREPVSIPSLALVPTVLCIVGHVMDRAIGGADSLYRSGLRLRINH